MSIVNPFVNRFKKEIICYGAAVYCREIRPILQEIGYDFTILVDDTPGLESPFEDKDLLHGFCDLKKWLHGRNVDDICFLITFSRPQGIYSKLDLQKRLVSEGLTPATLCARSADIDRTVELEPGVIVMRHATICGYTKIKSGTFINTKASIDHDCYIDEGSEISPGATVCGYCYLNKFSWVCAGATIGPRVTIGENSIIGAGATVLSDVLPNSVYVGTPARFLKENNLTPQNIKDHLEEIHE